jgi:hypothetical protein
LKRSSRFWSPALFQSELVQLRIHVTSQELNQREKIQNISTSQTPTLRQLHYCRLHDTISLQLEAFFLNRGKHRACRSWILGSTIVCETLRA